MVMPTHRCWHSHRRLCACAYGECVRPPPPKPWWFPPADAGVELSAWRDAVDEVCDLLGEPRPQLPSDWLGMLQLEMALELAGPEPEEFEDLRDLFRGIRLPHGGK